ANPHLKIFVANGYYDLATPYFATKYTFDRLALDETLRANVSEGFYEAGHMMYVHVPSLARMKRDLAGFIRAALAAAPSAARGRVSGRRRATADQRAPARAGRTRKRK